MSKVTLGNRPTQFKPFPVSYPAPDGTEQTVKVTFKYRTRKEFGAWLDSLMSSAAQAPDAPYMEDDAQPPATPVYLEDEIDAQSLGRMEGFFDSMNIGVADFILGCVDAWDADIPLTREAVMQYADEAPAGPEAVMTAYRLACREGKLGN